MAQDEGWEYWRRVNNQELALGNATAEERWHAYNDGLWLSSAVEGVGAPGADKQPEVTPNPSRSRHMCATCLKGFYDGEVHECPPAPQPTKDP